jgi:hypothetical protein
VQVPQIVRKAKVRIGLSEVCRFYADKPAMGVEPTIVETSPANPFFLFRVMKGEKGYMVTS